MSDSGRDWGGSSDESIRAFNAAKREAKIENAIKKLDSLHAETIQYGDWNRDDHAWPQEIAICDSDCIVLSTVSNKNSNNAVLQRKHQECSVGFTVAAYNSWPTISNELKRLRAFEHAMHSGEKSIVGLQADNDRLRQQVAELSENLDTEKRAAISIATSALSTGCVKPETESTIDAVRDIALEIDRLRDANDMLVGTLKVTSAECDQLREELRCKR